MDNLLEGRGIGGEVNHALRAVCVAKSRGEGQRGVSVWLARSNTPNVALSDT